MTDDTSAALERLKAVSPQGCSWIEWKRAWLVAIRAHIADLEARAKEAEAKVTAAEAFGHVFHTLPDGRLDFVAVREGSELGKLHQRAGAAEARAEKLRQERDDFADMVGAELCHQPGTVTAEWDAAKRRAEALTAEVALLRAALEKIDGAISAGITETDGPARVKAWGDTRIEDGFIVGQLAIQLELIMKWVQNVCREALAAAPAAPEKPSGESGWLPADPPAAWIEAMADSVVDTLCGQFGVYDLNILYAADVARAAYAALARKMEEKDAV